MLSPSLRLCDKGTLLCDSVLSVSVEPSGEVKRYELHTATMHTRPQLEFATSSPC